MRSSLRVAAIVPVLLIASLVQPPGASATATPVRSPGDPTYVVHLVSGTLGHVWVGSETVSFTNLRPAPLSTIYLRLWSNGVQGCMTPSAIEISQVVGGTAQAPTVDCTVVRVDLDTPVAQGGRGSIGLHVRIEVPDRNDRFGYHDGLALFGTALPTLAIRDGAGWHLDPFIDLGESFYSVVGTYRVSMWMPKSVRVVTTGVATQASVSGDGHHGATYVAHGVRDFEWAAGALQHRIGHVGTTRVVVSYVPGMISAATASAALVVARRSLARLGAAFGRFPYPEMDVVLTGFTTFGGMEYPTIIFTNPPKFTISHELAHQWWYGIVGDDQFHEPWLDESFATWSQYLPYGGWTRCGRYRFPSPAARITNDMTYWNTHQNQYDVIYSGGGCMLAALSARFGYQRFVHILRRYAADHWLGVSRTVEFKAAIGAAAARFLPDFDLPAFWAKWRVSS